MNEFDALRQLFRQRYNVVGVYDCEAENIMRKIEAGSGNFAQLRQVVSGMSLYGRMPDALALIDQAAASSSLAGAADSSGGESAPGSRRGRKAAPPPEEVPSPEEPAAIEDAANEDGAA